MIEKSPRPAFFQSSNVSLNNPKGLHGHGLYCFFFFFIIVMLTPTGMYFFLLLKNTSRR